jgi:hypothetical protein
MIRTLRTYRTLPALLATLLVLSVGLPVLCQVCAPAEAAASEHTAMHASHEAGHDTPAHCLHGHANGSDGVDAPHDMEGCDDAACTMTAEEPVPAVQTERMVLAVHDAPILMARAIALSDVVPSPPPLVRSDGRVEHYAHVPIRLQTASFLL